MATEDPLVPFADAPRRLTALLAGLSEGTLKRQPRPGKWSIVEIVGHLGDMELVLAYRIRLVRSAPGVQLQLMDQDAWAKTGRYDAFDVHDTAKRFADLRTSTLGFLRTLTAVEWDAAGMHPERGVESIRDMVRDYAAHDINHLRQIQTLVANSRTI